MPITGGLAISSTLAWYQANKALLQVDKQLVVISSPIQLDP